jgi:hypothetical protein
MIFLPIHIIAGLIGLASGAIAHHALVMYSSSPGFVTDVLLVRTRIVHAMATQHVAMCFATY